MKKYSLILAALMVVASQPAFAQTQPRREAYPNVSPEQMIDRVATQIDDDVRRGIITPAEAQRFRADVAAIRALQQRYRRGGISESERSDLLYRVDAIRSRLLGAEDVWLAQRGAPRENPVFQDVRSQSRLDNAVTRRLDRERSFQDRLFEDDGRDMNDLRGPPPPKHDEGSGLR